MQIAGRRFLITGGFGLLGSHIADELLKAGAGEVVLFDNGFASSAEAVRHLLSQPTVRMVRGDVLRLGDLLAAMADVDGVFHAAALITLPLADNPALGVDVNVRGLLNALEACRFRNVKKLIFTSSIATFGNAGDRMVDEGAPFVPTGLQPPSALYGLGKLMGEYMCALYGQRFGLEWVALRCATVYGERQHRRGVNVRYIVSAHDRIRQNLPPVIPGDGRDLHDYAYAGDVARAHAMAMESAVSGEAILIASGKPVSSNELVDVVLKVCGSSLRPEHGPEGDVRSAGITTNRYNIEKAAALLGWKPEVSLEEGIRRLIAWRERDREGAGSAQ